MRRGDIREDNYNRNRLVMKHKEVDEGNYTFFIPGILTAIRQR